jgi:hypothetical protein
MNETTLKKRNRGMGSLKAKHNHGTGKEELNGLIKENTRKYNIPHAQRKIISMGL